MLNFNNLWQFGVQFFRILNENRVTICYPIAPKFHIYAFHMFQDFLKIRAHLMYMLILAFLGPPAAQNCFFDTKILEIVIFPIYSFLVIAKYTRKHDCNTGLVLTFYRTIVIQSDESHSKWIFERMRQKSYRLTE